MQNKKIKLAVLESKYYGTVTSVNDLVVRLDRDRFDVMFLYLDGRPESENHLEKAGYTVRDLSQNKLLSIIRPEVIYELYRVLKQNQIDLLHCHAHKAALYGAIAGKFLPQMKIIAHVHGLDVLHGCGGNCPIFFLPAALTAFWRYPKRSSRICSTATGGFLPRR